MVGKEAQDLGVGGVELGRFPNLSTTRCKDGELFYVKLGNKVHVTLVPNASSPGRHAEVKAGLSVYVSNFIMVMLKLGRVIQAVLLNHDFCIPPQ
jgi:hypothetical protein